MAIPGAFSDAPHDGAEGGPARRPRRLGLPQLSFYVLGQLLGPVAMLALLMTGVVWMVKTLPLLDLVINRGQSAGTFLYLIVLYLPTLLLYILPIAFFVGSLYALQRLAGDSELVVMASAGYSRAQLAVPVLLAALLVMGLTYLCSLYLMPAGQRELNSRKFDINADIGAALLNEGQFNTQAKGLTIFIRQLSANGEMRDILAHDSRDLNHPVTYIARRGQLAQTPEGAQRLILFDAVTEQSSEKGARIVVGSFASYPIPLDQFAGPSRDTTRKASERFLDELLWPPEPNLTPQTRLGFAVEAYDRLSQPLYCLTFAFIAMAAVLRGRRQRGPLAMRLTLASLAAVGLRLAGYGVRGAAQNHPWLIATFYLIPLLGGLAAIIALARYSPAEILARRRSVKNGTMPA
jgi:lipopolysaccharide export system permease protein